MVNAPSQDEMRSAIQSLELQRERDERWVKQNITRERLRRMTAQINDVIDRALKRVRA